MKTFKIILGTMVLFFLVLAGTILVQASGDYHRDKVMVVWVSDPTEVAHALRQEEIELNMADESGRFVEGVGIVGLSIWSPISSKCTVYVYEPSGVEDVYAINTLGHEVLHCFRGDFHERMKPL